MERDLRQGRRALRTSLGLGMGLAATWLTREEGILALVPLVVLFLPLALRVVMRNGRDGLVRDLARCVGVTGAAFGTGVGAVMLLNLSHYGVFTLNDQTSGPSRPRWGPS